MGIVNPVVFWVFCVGRNMLLHVHILALKVGTLLFHYPTIVISQCTIFLPGLWLLFICLLVLLSVVGLAILPKRLPQNHSLQR